MIFSFVSSSSDPLKTNTDISGELVSLALFSLSFHEVRKKPALHLRAIVAHRVAPQWRSCPTVLPLISRAAALVMLAARCLREQGVTPRRCCTTATVRSSDYFQKVAVRVIEVDSAPAVPGIDLVALAAVGVGPVR